MKFLAALLALALVAFGVWATVAAPCGLFKFSPAREIPGRCIMEDHR